MPMQKYLNGLRDTCGKLATTLHPAQKMLWHRPTRQRSGQNIRGSDRILNCQIDSDAADRGHGVRGVSNREETGP